MGWFWRGVGTLLVGIFIGVVVVAAEDRVKGFFAEKTIRADFYPSAWHPYPIGRTYDPELLLRGSGLSPYEIEKLTTGTDSNFAKIEITNQGHRLATGLRFQDTNKQSDGSPLLPPHLLVISAGDNPKRAFHNEAIDVRIPDIEPGGTATLYMWRMTDLSSEFLMEDFRIISDGGSIRTKLHRYDNQESRNYNEPKWYTIVDRIIPGFTLFLMVSLIVALLAMAAIHESYIKKIMSDDMIYLSEKVRYDANPTKFQIDTDILK